MTIAPVLCTIEVLADLAHGGRVPERFVSPIVGLRRDAWAGDEREVLAWAELPDGERRPVVARDGESVWLNFDLAATLDAIRGETYPGARLARPIVSRLPFDYTILPTRLVGFAARVINRPVDREHLPAYPAYPLDRSADLLYALSRGDASACPMRWPNGRRYAVMLTHDVDSAWVFQNPRWLEECAAAEEGFALRSAWYVVSTAMGPAECARGLRRLREAGHEVGLHGYRHDARLPERSFAELVEIFTRGRDLVRGLHDGEPGYRAPWLSRSETMHRALAAAGYLYDTSAPSADFQRNNRSSNNGCGTLFPFMRAGLVVLPVTLPQDCMAASLGLSARGYWDWMNELTAQIRDWGGLVVVSTHLQPHHSANGPMLEGYGRLLERLAADDEAWLTLPRDVARWAREQLA